jgi:hypothetical protein
MEFCSSVFSMLFESFQGTICDAINNSWIDELVIAHFSSHNLITSLRYLPCPIRLFPTANVSVSTGLSPNNTSALIESCFIPAISNIASNSSRDNLYK